MTLHLPAPLQSRAELRRSPKQLSGPWPVGDLSITPGCGSSVCRLPAETHICLHPNLGRAAGSCEAALGTCQCSCLDHTLRGWTWDSCCAPACGIRPCVLSLCSLDILPAREFGSSQVWQSFASSCEESKREVATI